MFATLMFTFVGQAWASNPADPTADFRYSSDFAKAAWDGGPWYLLGIKEVGNRTSVLVFNWNSDSACTSHLWELGVTKQVKVGEGTAEIALFTDTWHGSENDTGAMLDWSNDQFGIGAILRTNGCSKLAARTQIAPNTTLNLSLTEAGTESPRWGIGYSAGKTRLELALDNETVWFRASQPHGQYFPELRTKFSDSETVIGFGLGIAG